MSIATVNKSDFIKFNVSPTFKALAAKKARAHGLTVSELGRTLFGAFILGMAQPSLDISPDFLALAEKAREDYRLGKTKTFSDIEAALDYLHHR